MSGPMTSADGPLVDAEGERPSPAVVERIVAREVDLAGTPVRRALPRRGRRTIGSWCFVDHFGPAGGEGPGAMAVGPHPHIGLQTVTWLLEGEVLHTDSVGSEQLIRPGQLNLMTAGRGVAHAEQTPAASRERQHGAQLWIAQPEATRHGDPAFEHHGSLPVADLGDGLSATVLVGELAGARSPARTDTPIVGAVVEADRATDTVVSLRPGFEYGVVVLVGSASVAGEHAAPGELLYLGEDRQELRLGTDQAATFLLLGGEPFADELLMWWNFVARTRDEVEAARHDWQAAAARFGSVTSTLDRIDAPGVPWR